MTGVLPILAVALAVGGYIPYIVAVLRRMTRPNRASWWIFAVSAGAGAASSWAAGARETVGVPVTYAICCCVVGILAIRRGEGGWSRLDRTSLAVAAGSLAVWWATGQPMLAIIMNCLVDAAGTVPTVVKAWRDPEREDGIGWLIWLAASVCNLAQVRAWDPAEILYPGTLAVAAVAVVTARYRRVLSGRPA